MKILEKIHSKEDKVVKYILQDKDGLISEASYIDNNTGKDIICVSSSLSCNLMCNFCHITDFQHLVKNKPLTAIEIRHSVQTIYEDLSLAKNNRMLLVSFMGCGEPLLNWENVLESMIAMSRPDYFCSKIRFAIATLIPKSCWGNYFSFIDGVLKNNLPVKIHLSLHFTKEEQRKKWMPAALEIQPALNALKYYQLLGGKTEIHYAMIEGVNDTIEDAEQLGLWLEKDVKSRVGVWQTDDTLSLKLMEYNPKDSLEYITTCKKRLNEFTDVLKKYGVKWEYYKPPGASVGASCGHLSSSFFLKYNFK